MRWNIVTNDGERSSATVFIGGKSLLADKSHPNFQKIVDLLLKDGNNADETTLRDLFDTAAALSRKFARLSERVTIKGGKVYFDWVVVDNALTETILKFHEASVEDFTPLVNFMEKIATNPSEHSRTHLYRWLSKHDFSLAPDGDFIAYKGISNDGKSKNAGYAIVNDEEVKGRVLNAPDTIIEMPRDQVTFDPSNGCSVGLHAGNWSYARSFGSRVVQVKINPRDVVSVPVDSNDQKLRVCRYKVLGKVDAPDTSLLYLGNTNRTQKVSASKATSETDLSFSEKKRAQEQAAAAKKVRGNKKAAAKKAAPAPAPKPVKLPRYYEQYKAEHFDAIEFSELRWLAKEWEVEPTTKTRKDITAALVKEAAARLKTW